MAGDWIPVRTRLHEEPEVMAIAEKTGRSVHETIGLLVVFWGWAQEVSEDGKIPLASCGQIVARIGGDDAFWCAVRDSGWLKTDSGIEVPGFDKYLSKGGKRRLKNKEYMRIYRGQSVVKS